MPYTFAQSQALFTRAQRSIAAGVNSGIRKMEAPVPLYFARGSGPHLWDVDGNHYLDFQLGQGALLYGHAPAGRFLADSRHSVRSRHCKSNRFLAKHKKARERCGPLAGWAASPVKARH
jgi:glutamate-1-semialdehyde 2,1-aminomutase